jgi:hypothetical protein
MMSIADWCAGVAIILVVVGVGMLSLAALQSHAVPYRHRVRGVITAGLALGGFAVELARLEANGGES